MRRLKVEHFVWLILAGAAACITGCKVYRPEAGRTVTVAFRTNWIPNLVEIEESARSELKRRGLHPAPDARVAISLLVGDPDPGCFVHFTDPKLRNNCSVLYDASGRVVHAQGGLPKARTYLPNEPRPKLPRRSISVEIRPEHYVPQGAEYE
jgi:hypothetical protein